MILGGANGSDAFGNGGLYVGRGGQAPDRDEWVVGRAATPEEVSSGVTVAVGETVLLAVRIDFLDGPDMASLYVNPTSGQAEPSTGAVFNGVDLGTFTQIAITNGNNSVWTTDEIRFATTWNEVVPSTVPEPNSLALWSSLGAMGLVATRRRRKR